MGESLFSIKERSGSIAKYATAYLGLIAMLAALLVATDFLANPSLPEAKANSTPWTSPIEGDRFHTSPGSNCVIVGSKVEGEDTVNLVRCSWVEHERRTGYGTWNLRPELTTLGGGSTLYLYRKPPDFADKDVASIYVSGPTTGEAILDPSTMSPPPFPTLAACMYVSMNGNAALQMKDGLSLDKIDWANRVNYIFDRYIDVNGVYWHNPSTGSKTVVGTSTYVIRWPDTPTSKVRFTSCGSMGLGGEVGVTALCPVRVNDLTITGPTGEGLPSRSEINAFADQTKPTTIDPPGFPVGIVSTFTKQWKSGVLKAPKTHSQGAPSRIAVVKGCMNNAKAPTSQKLPSPGNYAFDARVAYVKCSYSIFPGYDNGTYFGGCETAPSTVKTHNYDAYALCAGNLVDGKNSSYDFDPALCYSPACQWKPGEGNKVVIDNPVGATGDQAPLEKKVVNPRRGRLFASGVSTLWSVNLNQMLVNANAGLAAPKKVDGTKYTVFEMQKDSTPWNPNLVRKRTNVNHKDQYFASYAEDGTTKGVLSLLVSNGKPIKPKNGDERVPEWQGMLLSAYNSSAIVSGNLKPFIVRVHRNESWVLPTRVPVVTAIGVFDADGKPGGGVENIQQVMTCSSAPFFQSNGQCQGCVSYLSNRLIPVAR